MRTPLARPRRSRVAALVLVVALGAAACTSGDGGDGTSERSTTAGADRSSTTDPGGDGPPDTLDDEVADATEADYVEAMAANFGQAGGIFTEEGVQCLAGRWVDAIGADAFREAGIPPEEVASNEARLEDLEMGRSTAETVADSFEACGLQLRDAYLQMLEGDLSEQDEACVDDLLTEDAVRRSFVADLLGEELDPDPLTQFERCTR